jgi:hypothetical protein
MDNAFTAKISEGSKFTRDEVTADLRDIAEVWLGMYDGNFEFLVDLKRSAQTSPLSNGALAGVLNCMKASMVRNQQATLEPGMYQIGDDIFKVQATRQDKTRLYAKRLVVVNGDRLNDATEAIEHFDFEYAPGAIKALTISNRMDEATARAFGIRYGICCCCGKRLKDAKSVSLGIGPVCRKYFP